MPEASKGFSLLFSYADEKLKPEANAITV